MSFEDGCLKKKHDCLSTVNLNEVKKNKLPSEVFDEVVRVDPARGVDAGAAVEVGDEGLGLAGRVGGRGAEALAADGGGSRTLENGRKTLKCHVTNLNRNVDGESRISEKRIQFKIV